MSPAFQRPGQGSRPVPACAGIGLRAPHHDEFLARRPAIPWIEVHSENFFAAGGRQPAVLEALRPDYGLSFHGVGLSLGSTDPLDRGHLDRLAALCDRFEPALVSEHVSFSSAGGVFLNDLLPLPYTRECLDHLVARVAQVQDRLGRPILVENVSSYLQFEPAEYTEWDFVAELAARAGCGILLDVNNIHVSSRNHGFDPETYLAAIPPALVGEMHLAGFSVGEADGRRILIDTHSAPVDPAVWNLYRLARARFGPVPTLLERDVELPSLDALIAEARLADDAGAADALVA